MCVRLFISFMVFLMLFCKFKKLVRLVVRVRVRVFFNLQKNMTKLMKLITKPTHTPRMYTPMYYEPQNVIEINETEKTNYSKSALKIFIVIHSTSSMAKLVV